MIQRSKAELKELGYYIFGSNDKCATAESFSCAWMEKYQDPSTDEVFFACGGACGDPEYNIAFPIP